MTLPTLTSQSPSEPYGFWEKLRRIAKYASRHLLEISLLLYYTAQHPKVPGWEKICIYSALLYFINPMDVIPDFLPLGLTDDLTILSAALARIHHHIDDDIRRRVALMLDKLLGTPITFTSGEKDDAEL